MYKIKTDGKLSLEISSTNLDIYIFKSTKDGLKQLEDPYKSSDDVQIFTYATAATNSIEVKYEQAKVLGDEYALLVGCGVIFICFMAFLIAMFRNGDDEVEVGKVSVKL